MPSLPTRSAVPPRGDAVPIDGAGDRSDRGDIVIGWLTKIVVGLGLAGLVFFDAISVGTTAVNLTDQGQHAAREASDVWQTTGSVQEAYDAAVASAKDQNPANVVDPATFRIDPDDTVHLRVGRTATTIVLYRWGRTATWAELEREAKGRSVG
jgi:hypothetical protein